MSTRGMLGLMPRTRRGLVVFWTALVMLSIALQYAAAGAEGTYPRGSAAAAMPKNAFAADPPGSLKITKDLTGGPGNFSTDFDITVNCGEAGTFKGVIGFPDPGEATIDEIAAGAVCTVTEIIQENDPPLGFHYGPPIYVGNPATIVSGQTVTIGITNTLVPKAPAA